MNKLFLYLVLCTNFNYTFGMLDNKKQCPDESKQEQSDKQENRKNTQNPKSDTIFSGKNFDIKVINGEWWSVSKESID